MNRKKCIFCNEEVYDEFAVPMHYIGWTGTADDVRNWAHIRCLTESRRSEEQ